MVKEENAQYHVANKFVIAFLNTSKNATPELIEEWKSKTNLSKLKSALKKTDKPSHPLRPKSEYIFFCEETRPVVQEEMRLELIQAGKDVKVDIQKVTCELGHRWKQFKQVPDPDVKKRISELAEADKKRYHDEKDAMQKKKPKKDNHFRSKYLFFCMEEREKNPKINMRNIGVLWAINKYDEKLDERYRAAKLALTNPNPKPKLEA